MVDQFLAHSVSADTVGLFHSSPLPKISSGPALLGTCSVWIWRIVERLPDGTPVLIIQVSADRSILAVKAFRKSDTEEFGPFVLGAIRTSGVTPQYIRSFGLTKKQRHHISRHTGIKVTQNRAASRWPRSPAPGTLDAGDQAGLAWWSLPQ